MKTDINKSAKAKNFSPLTKIAHILLILLIGVQTITSCSSDSGSGGSGTSSSSGGGTVDECSLELPPVAFPYCNGEESVEIGGAQIWSKCNLNVAPSTGISLCYCNKSENCEKYGRLYDWATAMALPDSCISSPCSSLINSPHQGLCPAGWHIPSDNDWDWMITYAGNDKGSLGILDKMVGGYFKATSGWNDYEGKSGNGTDDYGFFALPGGRYSYFKSIIFGADSSFSGAGNSGNWWSSTKTKESSVNGISLFYGNDLFMRSIMTGNIVPNVTSGDKNYDLFSVRCMRDNPPPISVPGPPVVYGDKTYETVVIGKQIWMASNLQYGVGGSKCYNLERDYCQDYGGLYSWATAMALPSKCNNTLSTNDADCAISAKHQGICPSGWHIPSDAEWGMLASYIEGYIDCRECTAKHLKARSGWNDYSCYDQDCDKGTNISGNGEDTYGFAALPGGSGGSQGFFLDIGNIGYWWSASEYSYYANIAYIRILHYDPRGIGRGGKDIHREDRNKNDFFSVRCLKD